MPRETNAADVALAVQLQDRGETGASERKLERVRQAGMLDSDRSGLGQGRGSQSNRPDDEVERALEAFALLAEHGTYRDAFFAMFVDGKYVVSEEKLKENLLAHVDQLEQWVRRRGSGLGGEALDLALGVGTWAAGYAKRSKAFRELRARLDDQYKSLGHRRVPDRLADFFTEAVLLPLTGAPSSQEEGKRALEVAGVITILDDPYTAAHNTDVTAADALEHFPDLTFRRLRVLIRASTMPELERARDDAKAIVAFARAYGAFLKAFKQPGLAFVWIFAGNATPRQIALLVPAMVFIRRTRGENLDAFLEVAIEWTPGFTAFAVLLETLPDPLIDAIRREHPNPRDETKTELRHYIEQLAITNPEQHGELMRPRASAADVG